MHTGAHGELTIYADGSDSYQPTLNSAAVGLTDSFTYQLHHPSGQTETAQSVIAIGDEADVSSLMAFSAPSLAYEEAGLYDTDLAATANDNTDAQGEDFLARSLNSETLSDSQRLFVESGDSPTDDSATGFSGTSHETVGFDLLLDVDTDLIDLNATLSSGNGLAQALNISDTEDATLSVSVEDVLDSGNSLNASILFGGGEENSPVSCMTTEADPVQEPVTLAANIQAEGSLSYPAATTLTRADNLQQHHSFV